MDNTNKENIINDDIEISKYFRALKRNLKFISLFTLFGAIVSSTLTFSKENIWQGDFQIIVTSNTQETSNDKLLNNFANLREGSSNDNMTQLEILKSPSVLFPVFKYIKEFKESKGENIKNLEYENWINNNLEIYFKKNTAVLEIKYKDTDKKLINKSLKLISSKYQDYSKLDRKKKLNDTKNFLKTQINQISKKSREAKKMLNQFSLENNLAQIDNIGIYNNSNKNLDKNFKVNDPKLLTELTNSKLRFSYYFDQLLKYESEFIDKSTNYQKNSPTLINLKSKINNLKKLIRRPNEILIKYNDLQTKSERLSNTLNNLEQELSVINLSIARQQDPWKLISEPKIQSKRYAPKRREDVLIGIILSFLIACVITFTIENKVGLIYEIEDLKRNKNEKYIGKLYSSNKELNDEILSSNLIENNIKNKESKIGILSISNNFLDKNYLISESNYFKNEKVTIMHHFEIDKIKDFDYLISLYSLGEISFNNLIITNDILKIFKSKMIGWMIIENKEII